MMKTILLSAMAFAALGLAPAVAADLAAAPTYTKAPMVAPVGNWAGFYIGAMGGYGSESGSNGISGVFGGGTVGYNWQMNNVVFGLEADAAGGSISQSASIGGIVAASAKVDALGTARGRIGVAFDQVLLYGTGGYAWADTRLSATALGATITDSKVMNGWAAGFGAEWMFAPHWSVKAEYLYRSFASQTFFTNNIPGGVASGSLNVNSAQVGVNYHF